MNENELDLKGRIAYLIGKSVSYTIEQYPKIGYVEVCTKWKTAYLIEQILQVVIEDMKKSPISDTVSGNESPDYYRGANHQKDLMVNRLEFIGHIGDY